MWDSWQVCNSKSCHLGVQNILFHMPLRGRPFDTQGGMEVFWKKEKKRKKKKKTSPTVEAKKKLRCKRQRGKKNQLDPEIQWWNGNFLNNKKKNTHQWHRKKKKKPLPPKAAKKPPNKQTKNPTHCYAPQNQMVRPLRCLGVFFQQFFISQTTYFCAASYSSGVPKIS